MPRLKFKMIQVNVLHGKFLDALVRFLKQENPDIITMQEVTTGGENFYNEGAKNFLVFSRDALRMEGVFEPSFHLADDPGASFGNAVFVRGNIRSHHVVWLSPYRMLTRAERRDESHWPFLPRSILDASVEIDGRTMHVLSVHGAWNKDPIDTPENMRQAKLIAKHIKTLRGEPFLLGGDLNMTPESRVIRTIDAVAKNAMKNSEVRSTLHPTIHKTAKEKPNGLLVDYIYTSPHFTIEKIDVPVVAISDHLPVRAILSYDDV